MELGSLERYRGSKQFTWRAELKVDSYSDLNSCTPLQLSAFMRFMALCWWCQTAQCLLTHVREWVGFTRNLFMSGFKTEKMLSVSMSGEKQRHSYDDNTVSHFTNSSPLWISVILIVFQSCWLYVLSWLSICRRLPFSPLHFVQELKLMGWHSSSEGYLWHWEKPCSCYCIQAQQCLWGFLNLCYCLFFLNNLYQKCFNTVGPTLNMCLD